MEEWLTRGGIPWDERAFQIVPVSEPLARMGGIEVRAGEMYWLGDGPAAGEEWVMALWSNVHERRRVKLTWRVLRARWIFNGRRPWQRKFWSPWTYVDRPGALIRTWAPR